MAPTSDADPPPFPDAEDRLALAETCERCPELCETRERISWGNGPLDAEVLVVGEAPGAGNPEAERWRGGNYTGMAYTNRRSGRTVRRLLADAGCGHEDCFFTTAVRCHPPDERDPTETELGNCRPYLREELSRVDPRAVVATGKHATRSVLALDDRTVEGIVDHVFDPKPCPSLGTTVVPIFHPSYQEVWIGRIGHDYESYVAELRTTLDAVE